MSEELSCRGREMGASGLRSSSKQTVKTTYDDVVQSLFTLNVALELSDERARPEGLAERIEGRVECIKIVCCAGGRTSSDVLGVGDVRVRERGLVELDRVEGELGVFGCHCCLLSEESVGGLPSLLLWTGPLRDRPVLMAASRPHPKDTLPSSRPLCLSPRRRRQEHDSDV